jgi:hypothetical protein
VGDSAASECSTKLSSGKELLAETPAGSTLERRKIELRKIRTTFSTNETRILTPYIRLLVSSWWSSGKGEVTHRI